MICRVSDSALGMTQSLSKRKFLAAQFGHRPSDGGNTTSNMVAALTVTLSLDDRERRSSAHREAVRVVQ